LKVLIKFLGPIAKDDLEVEVSSIDELKKVIKENVEDKWIDSLGVAINDRLVKSLDEVKNGDVISLLPPVCGG
jgi:molybdopterin synthase sulfur carrier subunit